ncbi:MAG TPA: MBL fold metallo-hydrolase [Niabella sp.]|nr:MBL fold metallo-hydrolase [Niabella sp.]
METITAETKTKWVLDTPHSELTFKVKHMMITNVKGEFNNFLVEFNKKVSLAAMLMFIAMVIFGGQVNAQTVKEAPSTVDAKYVPMSVTEKLKPGEKVGNLYNLNNTQEYILQRITDKTYWYQRQFYGTIFYVGDEGVLLIDPLGYQGQFIQKAIKSVTRLPVTAMMYSHNHADHIGDAQFFVDEAKKEGRTLRIIASKATVDKQDFLNSRLPKATDVVAWPNGSFTFENLKVQLSGFERASHADDHGVWLLTNEKIAHLPDLVSRRGLHPSHKHGHATRALWFCPAPVFAWNVYCLHAREKILSRCFSKACYPEITGINSQNLFQF